MNDWFFYGTLLDDEVFRAVTGMDRRRYDPQDAVVHSYSKVTLPGQSYPTLVRRTGSRSEGQVCRGLDVRVVRRLTDYEGADYERILLPVQLSAGRTVICHTFAVTRPLPMPLKPWSLDAWQHSGRALTLKRIKVLGRP